MANAPMSGRMVLKIAIPRFNETVAPCFETAGSFMICDIENGKELSSQIISCTGCDGFGQVRFLQENDINILICNGIKGFYMELLKSAGLTVIDKVTVTIEEALWKYLNGQLKPRESNNRLSELSSQIPHEDLVCWAKELFESHGYSVSIQEEEEAPFPVDLIAEMSCPVCHKPIRVAVCCGAHTYRADHEIREFHHASPSSYQAKVFVFPGNPLIKKRCREYEIQLIDPDSKSAYRDQKIDDRIPLINYPIPGHEKAFVGQDSHKEREQ